MTTATDGRHPRRGRSARGHAGGRPRRAGAARRPPPSGAVSAYETRQTFLLLLAIVPEALLEATLIPLYPFMVRHLLPSEPNIGYFVGLLGSAFYLPLFLMNLVWGAASDRYGRKVGPESPLDSRCCVGGLRGWRQPVLVAGLVVCLVTTIAIGFSRTFWLTVACRFVAGVFGANSTVAKGMLGDIARDDAARSWAYAMYGSIYGSVGILGPILGGLLADPATLYPGTFGSVSFLRQFPFALPCLLGAGLAVCGLLSTVFLLQEHSPMRRSAAVGGSASTLQGQYSSVAGDDDDGSSSGDIGDGDDLGDGESDFGGGSLAGGRFRDPFGRGLRDVELVGSSAHHGLIGNVPADELYDTAEESNDGDMRTGSPARGAQHDASHISHSTVGSAASRRLISHLANMDGDRGRDSLDTSDSIALQDVSSISRSGVESDTGMNPGETHRSQAQIPQQQQQEQQEQQSEPPPAPFSLLSARTLMPILLYCTIALTNIMYMTSLPLYLSASADVGGGGLNSRDTSFCLTVISASKLFTQLVLFQHIKRYFVMQGSRGSFQAAMGLFVPIHLIVPSVASIVHPSSFLFFAATVVLMSLFGVGEATSYLSVIILITESAAGTGALGLAHGFAATMAACVRTIGPALAGSLWESGVATHWPSLAFVVGASVALCGSLIAGRK
nr:hypothetical protein HK105_004524 [Polyrhizophydium stewartii]